MFLAERKRMLSTPCHRKKTNVVRSTCKEPGLGKVQIQMEGGRDSGMVTRAADLFWLNVRRQEGGGTPVLRFRLVDRCWGRCVGDAAKMVGTESSEISVAASPPSQLCHL